MRSHSLLILVPLLILSACRKEGVTVEGEPIGVESIQQAMPVGGKVELSGHGREVWFGYGAMTGGQWTPANGVITAHVLEDGFYVLTMNLNVEQAKEGTFYEVWAKHLGTGERVSAGHLTSGFGDARHGMRFENETDLREYTEITVTLENDDGNPSASTHVIATGTLKPTKR